MGFDIAKNGDLALSFSGCGFLGTYHFGVLECLGRNAKTLMSRVKRCAGSSAGALVAALCVFAPNTIQLGLSKVYSLAEEINSLRFGALTPGFLLNERLVQIVDEHIPQDVSSAESKLFISLTKHETRENKLVSKFHSRDYLIQCLMASCYIPLYSMGFGADPPLIDNVKYVDGGYSNNLPIFSDTQTLTISPFSGGAMITPQDHTLIPYFEWTMRLGNQCMNVNMQNILRGAQALFPPSNVILHGYYEMGFRDTLKFLIENDFYEREEGTSI